MIQKDKNKIAIDYVDNSTNWSNASNDAEPSNKELFIKTVETFLRLANAKFGQSNIPITALVQSK
jgi:hypothetical protein